MTEYDIGNLINYCKSKEEKVNTTKEIIKLSKEHKVKVGAVYVIENTIFGKCYIGQTEILLKYLIVGRETWRIIAIGIRVSYVTIIRILRLHFNFIFMM